MATIKILIWHQTLLSRGILISDCLNFAGLILWLIILSNTFWKYLVAILNLSCLPYSIEEEFEDTKGVIGIRKLKDRQHNCQQKKKTRILNFYVWPYKKVSDLTSDIAIKGNIYFWLSEFCRNHQISFTFASIRL